MPSCSSRSPSSVPTSRSSRASTRSWYSRSVTSEPSRRKNCASSTPTRPPPSTTRLAGHAARPDRIAVRPVFDVGRAPRREGATATTRSRRRGGRTRARVRRPRRHPRARRAPRRVRARHSGLRASPRARSRHARPSPGRATTRRARRRSRRLSPRPLPERGGRQRAPQLVEGASSSECMRSTSTRLRRDRARRRRSRRRRRAVAARRRSARRAEPAPSTTTRSAIRPQRRGRDLNPRRTFQHVRDFQSRSFGRSDTSPRDGQPSEAPCRLTFGHRRHVRRDVLDLLLAERVLERRHCALAVRHALDRLVVRGARRVEVRPDRACRPCVRQRVAAAARGGAEEDLLARDCVSRGLSRLRLGFRLSPGVGLRRRRSPSRSRSVSDSGGRGAGSGSPGPGSSPPADSS